MFGGPSRVDSRTPLTIFAICLMLAGFYRPLVFEVLKTLCSSFSQSSFALCVFLRVIQQAGLNYLQDVTWPEFESVQLSFSDEVSQQVFSLVLIHVLFARHRCVGFLISVFFLVIKIVAITSNLIMIIFLYI